MNGKEYVLTQPKEGFTADEAQEALQNEAELLAKADEIHKQFKIYADNCEVPLPSTFFILHNVGCHGLLIPHHCRTGFNINFKGTILGRLHPNQQGHGLPYEYFLATPLLPCGRFDGRVKKFTGNEEFGSVSDHDMLTQAIHAFVHFGCVFTRDTLLLCDIQGVSIELNDSPDLRVD